MTYIEQAVILFFIFVFGSFVGSFLNVCIYRLPRGKSLAKPARSYCPICHETIAWHDNIPLFSYFALGRMCRRCGSLISPRYFIVELLTAIGFVAIFLALWRRQESPAVITVYLILFSMLVVSSFIDLELRIIPDEITIGGIFLVPIISLLVPALHNVPQYGRDLFIFHDSSRLGALCACLLGMAVGAFLIYATGVAGKLIFRKEAMGMGDVKFIAVIGGLLGWKLVVLVFFVAPVIGSIVGIIVLLKSRDHHIPYGPFLSLATVIIMLFGGEILRALTVTLVPV